MEDEKDFIKGLRERYSNAFTYITPSEDITIKINTDILPQMGWSNTDDILRELFQNEDE